jgi:hypothetical protein
MFAWGYPVLSMKRCPRQVALDLTGEVSQVRLYYNANAFFWGKCN